MYQPTTRLLTVLELLQARPFLSGAELARRLEVDGRTVRRYVTMLQDMGIPVEAAHGRHGGYRLRPGYKLPPLLFTEEEAVAVTLGLLAARHLGLFAAAPAAAGALAKIERVLPVTSAERIRALEETIAFTQRAAHPVPAASEALLSLSSAAQNRRRIWLSYRDAAGAESDRYFDPYGLVFHYGRWYLVGLDQRSGEMRSLRVDRIQALEATQETFERPAGFDAVGYLVRSLANIPWGTQITVVLETTLEEAATRLPAYAGNLVDQGGRVLLRTYVDDLRMAARYLAGLGWPFSVLSPPELREEVRALAQELLQRAAD